MGTVSRGTKTYGGTAYQDTKALYASELEGDFNPIVNAVNGGLDDVNIAAAANIDPSKIGDASATDTDALAMTSPGDSSALSKATNLIGELQRLRYAIGRQSFGIPSTTSPVRHGSTGTSLGGWIDEPPRGRNLVIDGSFEAWSSATALISWSLVGTPTLAKTSALVTEGAGNCVKITSAAAAEEGVSQTLSGLKASTKYLISARARLVSGGGGAKARLEVTGADAASEYRSLVDTDLETDSVTFVTLCGIVKTDATPTALVVRCITNAVNPCVAEFEHVTVREMSASMIETPREVVVTSVNTTATAGLYDSVAWVDAGPSVSLTPPGPGYQIIVNGFMSVGAFSGASSTLNTRLLQNGSELASAYSTLGSSFLTVLSMSAANLSPTPGTTYTYTMDGRSNTAGRPWDRNPNLGLGATASTYIIARMFSCG